MNKWQKKTDDVLMKMLRENTGVALCDSGGAYGRNWERNARRDFMAEPAAKLEIDVVFGSKEHSVQVEANLFHWLRDRVDYDPGLQRSFRAFCRRKANADNGDLTNMELFAEEQCEKLGLDPGSYCTENSYNRDNVLDQTIQWTAWPVEDPEYVLLQVHGGCDVRGGYTSPVAFQLKDGDFHIGDAGISCPDCHEYWQTDDTVHWYFQGSCGAGWDVKALQNADGYRLILPIVPQENPDAPWMLWQKNYVDGLSVDEIRAWEILVALHRKEKDLERAISLYPGFAWERIASAGEEQLMAELHELRKHFLRSRQHTVLALPHGKYTCPFCPTGTLVASA